MIHDEPAISSLISEMTLAEKVGQMTQVSNEAVTPTQVADNFIGSVLSGGNGNPAPNTPSVWADMVGSFVTASDDTRLEIPLLYGVDAVHGHSNVRGATVFPHNIGLGAAGDADLVERIGRATATEMAATGIHWAFAPTIAVPQDIRWGRTYEGYGRNPELVSRLGKALITGLQDPHWDTTTLACAKHFVADGATGWGTAARSMWSDWWDGWGETWQIDQGDASISETELRTTHLLPYAAAIEAGVMTVMASYSSWNGVKMHGHRHLLTEVLKGELGFRGFVVSDWMGVDQLGPDYEENIVTSINAGVDMVMVPEEFERFIDAMTQVITSGLIPVTRIDDAVARILRAKRVAGLTASKTRQPSLQAVGSAEHRSLAAEAVRRSVVLLKNDDALPLPTDAPSIHVAGKAANDIGLQCGGWTVGWQGGTGRVTPGTTLLEGLRASVSADVEYDPTGRFTDMEQCDIAVVCIAEPPYAEGPGDSARPTATDEDCAVFARMRERARVLVLVIYSGRPLIIPELAAKADAVVAAWLPGSEGAALGELLAGQHSFEGQTPQPWPRAFGDLDDPMATPLYAVGHGLRLLSSPSFDGVTQETDSNQTKDTS